MSEITNEQWERCYADFLFKKTCYQELDGTPGVNVQLALQFVIAPLERRYLRGERTEELFAEMNDLD